MGAVGTISLVRAIALKKQKTTQGITMEPTVPATEQTQPTDMQPKLLDVTTVAITETPTVEIETQTVQPKQKVVKTKKNVRKSQNLTLVKICDQELVLSKISGFTWDSSTNTITVKHTDRTKTTFSQAKYNGQYDMGREMHKLCRKLSLKVDSLTLI